jgi:hypothetical protein
MPKIKTFIQKYEQTFGWDIPTIKVYLKPIEKQSIFKDMTMSLSADDDSLELVRNLFEEQKILSISIEVENDEKSQKMLTGG